MGGHYICDRCGYEGGDHATYCRYLRPMSEQWRGNKTKMEMEDEYRAKRYRELGIDPANLNPDGSDHHLIDIVDAEITLRHKRGW